MYSSEWTRTDTVTQWAFRLKKALHDLHNTALKLYPGMPYLVGIPPEESFTGLTQYSIKVVP
jgi:hypothetical protein